jgi:flagellar hook-basal body complex protein FliE
MIPGLSAVEKTTGTSFATLEGMSNIAGPAAKAPNVLPEVSFASALATATQNAVGTLRDAETLSLKAIQGEVETREVVDAVMSAEQTLQTAIAIRDKIVSSYLEISRMAI